GRVPPAEPPFGQREGLVALLGESAVEVLEVAPVGVAGVEVGADPVDVAVAGVVVPRVGAAGRGRAVRQRAPDPRDRRLRQLPRLLASGPPQAGQPELAQLAVDLP